jgi:hypothetical protein
VHRQLALKAIANLNAHLVFSGSNKEQYAVVLLGFAKLPVTKEFVNVGLAIASLQRFHSGGDELDAGLAFRGP